MNIPRIARLDDRPVLMVNDEPILLFGGEIHNSSASDLGYMEREVWPHVRKLHLNSLIVPVAWEFLEPKSGEFDFTLPDGLIAQAEREGIKLVFLWFGLWKNGMSTYIPAWMKRDRQVYFPMCDRTGKTVNAVSPLCREAVERDAAAFSALMAHLRDFDKNRTVVLVQVENEMGLLGDCRDFSSQANEIYEGEIPGDMERFCGQPGTWEDVFGEEAPEKFMVYAYAKAVERIASAGKKEYPLPMYVNAWLEQYPWVPGTYPVGGPVAKCMELWKTFAPSIDLYAPDIYLPDFEAVCKEYAVNGNPLFVPEARPSMDSASNAFSAFGEFGALGFSPFAIESVAQGAPQPLEPDLNQLNIMAEAFNYYRAGEYLSEAYDVLQNIQQHILECRMTPKMKGFTRNGRQAGTLLKFEKYNFLVEYLPHGTESPKGGGIVIELSEDEFLICGMNFQMKPMPKYHFSGAVEIESITEGRYENRLWKPGRRLNGDEFRIQAGGHPALLRVRLNRYPRVSGGACV